MNEFNKMSHPWVLDDYCDKKSQTDKKCYSKKISFLAKEN